MRAQGVSRTLVQNDLPVRRQQDAGKSGEDFSALLKTESPTGVRSSTFQEAPLSPMCSSGCSDSAVSGVTDSGRAAVVYQQNVVLYPPAEGVSPTSGSDARITSQTAGPSYHQGEKTPVRPAAEGSVGHESTDGLGRVVSEIKSFFARLFALQGSSSREPQPAARGEAAESGSFKSAAEFFRRPGTLLSFGLRRPEESQKSDKASTEDATKASEVGGDSLEQVSQANVSSLQDLPTGEGEATGAGVVRTTGSSDFRVSAKIQEAIHGAARKYGLSADLITAIIKVESNFNAGAVSREGAGGLMQLMPSTAKALAVRNRFDIQQNIDGGSRYLKSLLERFGGKVELALAAYNVGPEAVERYGGVPPYRQTRNYVKKVLAHC